MRSTPASWARNNTVTPSYRAVPFWFAVAPTVSTKVLISRGTPRFSSDTRSAVGSVAFDDEVENAVSITVRMRRKNSTANPRQQRHRKRIHAEHVQAKPISTVTTNHASAKSRSKPKRAVVVNNRQATAKGRQHHQVDDFRGNLKQDSRPGSAVE